MEWKNRSAYVFIKTYPGKAEQVYKKITDWENTIGVVMTTGDYDMIAWIDTEGIGDAYQWITQVRCWPEVERTSTHQTYYGYRNDRPFWDMPAYAWFKFRCPDFQSTYDWCKTNDNVAFAACIPGDYDYIGMCYGKNYNEVYDYMAEFKAKGYEVEYYAPLKCWWNQKYEQKWQQYEKYDAKVPC